MLTFLVPLPLTAYIELPKDPVEWIGVLIAAVLLLWAVFAWREKNQRWQRWQWLCLAAFVPLVIVTSLFFGYRLQADGALPRPLLPEDPQGPVVMFFLAAPWFLAGGLLGPLGAVLLGMLSGLVSALFETHSLFTILQMGFLALIFSLAVRQRYRTPIYRILRHPLVAAVLVTLLYAPLYLAGAVFEQSGALAARLDYGIAWVGVTTATFGVQALIAGVIAEIAARTAQKDWGKPGDLQPSPSESSLQMRFFYGLGPYVLVLLLTLMVGDWIVAGRAARNMLEEQLSTVAKMGAESVPLFLESGQNLIQQISEDPRLLTAVPSELPDLLSDDIRAFPYFRQLYLFDQNGEALDGYPESDPARFGLTPDEEAGVEIALQGVSIQTYTVPGLKGETTAQIAFIAAVKDPSGATQRVLLGRSDLATNPFTKPLIATLEQMKKDDQGMDGGEVYGIIVDDKGQILYHPSPSRVMTGYLGRATAAPLFFDETGPEGTRNLVYYQPISGQRWAMILTAPAQRAQQLALTIATPLLILILLMAVVVIASLRISLGLLSANLHRLSQEAGRIAEGNLDQPLPVKGVDEVGRLSLAFEQMRVSLKSRLEELNGLLVVTQGVAGSLQIEAAAQPILNAALGDAATSARIVLAGDPQQVKLADVPGRFGIGEKTEAYAYLDEQILALSRQRDRILLTNLTRGRGLNFGPLDARPSALVAIALRHEDRYFGTLWLAYDHPRAFADDEVRFLTTLAGQAALAAANTGLYTSAEIGRQRLEAVLTSTPDPILVTDQKGRLLLVNPAARQLSGLMGVRIEDQTIERSLPHQEFIDLLHAASDEPLSREVAFPNGKIYYVTVSSVRVEGKPVGRVCILRDITHYKELDTLKSEFVATVSHDLRSPLTLMRGYATMLQMVGDLNEQQKSYMRKIISGVEGMSRLVSNLLDLGRIEAGVGLQIEDVAINDVVERVLTSLQMQVTQKKIQLVKELPDDGALRIQADPALLQQAFYNLVENAIKYTPVGGDVKVEVRPEEDSVLFVVMDTGTGIAPLDQPHLFERFYRGGPKEIYQQRGSGLGLAIVKSIAERHRGRVWVESYLGRGSTFYLEIPAAYAELIPA